MIIDILDLPAGVVPVTTLVMGYPDETPAITDRLPLGAVVHHDKYRDYTPKDIDRFYQEKESSPLTLKLLKENSLETLAQIFTQKRYTKKDNELFSGKLLDVIRKQGFGEGLEEGNR